MIELILDSNLLLKFGDHDNAAKRRLGGSDEKAMISPGVGAGKAGG
jgi:hypothetical protein